MARRKPLKPRIERIPSAKQAAAGLVAAALAASAASPISAEEYRTLLQGQTILFDTSLFSDTSVIQLDSIVYDQTYLDKYGTDPFRLKAIQPTASTLVTLYGLDEFDQTVTESVYVEIVENAAPIHFYDNLGGDPEISFRPGGQGDLMLMFYDPDLQSFPDAEQLTYSVTGLPEFIDYEFFVFGGQSSFVYFYADESAVPGTYPATLTATDIGGNQTSVNVNIQVNPPFEPRNPYLYMNTTLFDEVPIWLLYFQFLGEDFSGEFIPYMFEIEHEYGSDVQLFQDDLESGRLSFAKAGTYDLLIYGRNAVDDSRSLPVKARFEVDEHYAVYGSPSLLNISSAGSPVQPSDEMLIVYGNLPGAVYLMPYEEGYVPTVEDLEFRYETDAALKIPLGQGEGFYEAGFTPDDYNLQEGWYSLYIAGDGQIQYAKHFMFAGDDISIDDILNYYDMPVYPPDDELMLQVLLRSITTVVDTDTL